MHDFFFTFHLTFNINFIGNNRRDTLNLVLTDCSNCRENVYHKEFGVVCL